MSKVVMILVEGSSERDFVNNCLRPYLNQRGIIIVRPIGIETSPGHKGGDVRYHARYKPNIEKLLRGSEDMLVTSFIDFYRLRNDFPKYTEAKGKADPIQRVGFLEEALSEDINDSRFIPYIQLHEYEGLLFSRIDGFEGIDEISSRSLREIRKIINDHPNPELINEGANTAPSKRLEHLIPDYKKIGKPFYGCYIALENGIQSILDTCPRFKNWVELIIQRATA